MRPVFVVTLGDVLALAFVVAIGLAFLVLWLGSKWSDRKRKAGRS